MKHFSKASINELKAQFLSNPGYVAYGTFYGFPQCCIVSFCNTTNHTRKIHKGAPYYGTGFIPCPKCQKSARENWNEFKKVIQNNRISEVPFPYDHREEEGDIFFIIFARMLNIDSETFNFYIDTYCYLKDIIDNEEEKKDIFQKLYQRFTVEE